MTDYSGGANGSLEVSPDVTTTYTLTATGPGGSSNAEVTVTFGAPAPPPAGAVTVLSISYSWSGGRDGYRHLEAEVLVVDAATLAPAADIAVAATLTRVEGNAGSWNFGGTTGGDGTIVFKLIGAGNAAGNCCDLNVTAITGADWVQPEPVVETLDDACRS